MVELYPHQKEALTKIKPGSILVGGVGSGKSITALAYYYSYICNGQVETLSPLLSPKNLYIITTARKRDSLEWHEECARFNLSTHDNVNSCGIKVVIDSWNNIKKYEQVCDAFFIFDEQRVVGAGSWVKSFLKIAKNNKWILLSATPGDTWSDYIPVFVANRFYKNRTDFLRKHAVFDRFAKYPKISRYIDTDRLIYFRKKILVTMDFNRHTSRFVKDILVDYDKTMYDIAYKNRWDSYKNEPIKDAGQLCYILRKIVNTDRSRLLALIDLLKIHPKIIVFYNLNSELEILRTIKESDILKNVSVAEWNGHKHEPIPDSDSWVYLVQYTAGSEGWNCVQTDTVIFYSLNYSFKIMEQASGRIDRINTRFKKLYYYRFVSNSTIDRAILKALKNKRNFNELAFANI